MSFTPTQRRQLRARLNPDHVRSRVAEGQILSYLEGWHVIAEANRIFGFEGWDRETLSSTCVYSKQVGERYCAAYAARVRITVRAGELTIIREGSGAGEANVASPGQAHEVAAKAAETDATKRALMTFGNAFGLSLYKGVLQPAERGGRAAALLAAQNQPPMTSRDKAAPGEPAQSVADANETRTSHRRLGGPAADVPQPTIHPDQTGAVDRTARSDVSVEVSSVEEREPRPDGNSAQLTSEERGAAASERNTPQTALDHPAVLLPAPQPHVRIDKSALTLSEPRRLRDAQHLRFVASHACLVCGRQPTQAHHLKFTQAPAMSRKVSDEYTVPLCALHHRELHDAGNELNWWQRRKLDPVTVALDLWARGRRHADVSRELPLNGSTMG